MLLGFAEIGWLLFLEVILTIILTNQQDFNIIIYHIYFAINATFDQQKTLKSCLVFIVKQLKPIQNYTCLTFNNSQCY